MGGKTKHAQRTKNNAKPSSSASCAQLLGTSTPGFVGFSAHSELGLVPLVPGFSTTEQLQESFDASISTEFQLVLRKLTKKDPVTKQKGLQEFIDLVNATEVEELKTLLPFWPKYFQNLATDTEHNVRESCQTLHKLLVSKCKRAIAPQLKLLVPVWLCSHYDNYAPAASIAKASFRETFVSNTDRTQEVCLHCQVEIVEHMTRNLTFHTASTLSSGKGLTPEEAEQKYQRVVVSSFKALSFFLEKTSGAAVDLSRVLENMRTLVTHQKLWSFSKSKIPKIKAAFFEFFYHMLQNSNMAEAILPKKTELIAVCFQNINESEPLVAPQVWACILSVQNIYSDWHTAIKFKETVQPKLLNLLRNNFNNNARDIGPNLLPFLSKLSHDVIPGNDLYICFKRCFDEMKSVFCTKDAAASMARGDNAAIIKTYFECLRFVFQNLNRNPERNEEEEKFVTDLFNENVMAPLLVVLNEEDLSVKNFYSHLSALVVYWAERQAEDNDSHLLYRQLLNRFWNSLGTMLIESTKNKCSANDESCLDQIIQFVCDLHSAKSHLEDRNIKFSDEVDGGEQDKTPSTEFTHTSTIIQKDLREVVIQLVKLLLEQLKTKNSTTFVLHICRLTKLFAGLEFYMELSEEKTLQTTLGLFTALLKQVDESSAEAVVEVVFDILQQLEKSERFKYIDEQLLKIPNENIQTCVLQRLLSYPLCIEPEVRQSLAQTEVSAIIVNAARAAVAGNSTDKFNLLHKCFFQTDLGEILISPTTVDAILDIVSERLISTTSDDEMIDTCGSFIAQIMPVVCSNKNSSIAMQRATFLKLFKFTIERTTDDYLSEETLWEITTCWQDALSSGDIVIDESLLKACSEIVQQRVVIPNLAVNNIEDISEAIAKFVICSTENIKDEEQRNTQVDVNMAAFFQSAATSEPCINAVTNYCIVLEALGGVVTAGVDLVESDTTNLETEKIFRQKLLNLCTILKLTCKKEEQQVQEILQKGTEAAGDENEDDVIAEVDMDEITENYCDAEANLLKHWSEFLYKEILQCINVASIGSSLLQNAPKLTTSANLEQCLMDKVKILMGSKSEIVAIIKERMLKAAVAEDNITACRAILFLVHCSQYADFEESAIIVLMDELAEYFTKHQAFRAYAYTLQYFLPHLKPRTITIDIPIMFTEPKDIWVKAAIFRCLIGNNFSEAFNEKSDRNIIDMTMRFVTELTDKQTTQGLQLLYSVEVHKFPQTEVSNVVEYIHLLSALIKKFPYALSIKIWDSIRLGLSSWVLSVSRSVEHFKKPKVAIFTAAVFKLYTNLMRFINEEKQKSSTQFLNNMIDEWEKVFSREVNVVLFKVFYNLCNLHESATSCSYLYFALLHELTPAIELLDYSFIYSFCKNSKDITLENLSIFILKNLAHREHSMRVTCAFMLRQLTPHFVRDDINTFNYDDPMPKKGLHFLQRFEDYITRYDFAIRKYLDEFSFKLTEIPELKPIDRIEGLSYLLLWDCIVYVCANSPTALRSVYTNWLNENKFEENLLHFLFRAMPAEILRNHDSKIMSNSLFKGLDWQQLSDENLSVEKYACHLYTEVLRRLPAVARKWWNSCPSRQKVYVDKLTTNFISTMICNEELKAIVRNNKEKHENMQISVHTSSREVLAVYSIDEVRMELVITLAPNHPLGAVKVEFGKNIGTRLSSRNVKMQLTMLLTHQNGTIYDCLTLWKNSLDKKFDGVEECYVCYTVIHQETCQLPRLTCKTCKKKFHGPCLYKWFTTSNKSTCPICRNIF